MAFSDLGTNNYGTWHTALSPEPDDPVSLYWIKYVSQNVARLTKCAQWERYMGLPDEQNEYDLSTMVYRRLPFAKLYVKLSDGWTDRYSVGEGNSWNETGSVSSLDLRFPSFASAVATLAALQGEALLDSYGGMVGTIQVNAVFWGK